MYMHELAKATGCPGAQLVYVIVNTRPVLVPDDVTFHTNAELELVGSTRFPAV